ncbi:molybdate ABC transporter substrate-binding protein [Terriglobus sp. TAA 43]|uniref:molybdate ABC transporter substrate-binding protein n=1 Tax=Terriglobus sp. TAA 43 TaxID=278961 RepID=UPI0006467FA7|nr:molybdate ABC transporter substrate-binding protein [Terriglobus sp. TAA 43]
MLRLRFFAVWIFAALLCSTASLHAQNTVAPKEVIVAAAADMEPVLTAYAPLFEKQTGLKLKISYAASAALSQQIQNGLPADIFFSADFYFAEQTVASGLTMQKAPTPYAKGALGLWARNDSRFKPLTIDVLSRKDLGPVAVANPDRAPYGRAAIAALKQMNLYANVAPHIVQADSISQAGQFALSGNAEVAFISRTMAVSPKFKDAGQFVLIPLSQYPEIVQTAVILKNGANHEGAHLLLNFILSDKVQSDLDTKGLGRVK